MDLEVLFLDFSVISSYPTFAIVITAIPPITNNPAVGLIAAAGIMISFNSSNHCSQLGNASTKFSPLGSLYTIGLLLQ